MSASYLMARKAHEDDEDSTQINFNGEPNGAEFDDDSGLFGLPTTADVYDAIKEFGGGR